MKKLLSGMTAMVLVLGLFTTCVQAEENIYEKTLSYDQVVQMVEQTDKEIYEEIDKADNEADRLVLSYESANLSYEQFIKERDKIINELIKSTGKKVEKTIEQAAKSGFIVEPILVEVEIGGKFVFVDPCRVIDF
jgi:chemotaxis regulatin CheY-phosphate phosphatase CheZ